MSRNYVVDAAAGYVVALRYSAARAGSAERISGLRDWKAPTGSGPGVAVSWASCHRAQPGVAGEQCTGHGLDQCGSADQTGVVSKREVDDYLESLGQPEQSTLRELRETILALIPQAEQCISYGIPGFRLHGTMVAGFAAYKEHLSYFPHSGSVLAQLGDDVAAYSTSRGTLRFPIDAPLPRVLVEKLLAVRIGQVPCD